MRVSFRLRSAMQVLGGKMSSIFEGAGHSRARSSPSHHPQDVRRDLNRFTRLQLLSKARWLYVNDGLTRGAINDVARYSVGSGLTPQAQTRDSALNDQYEEYWRQWCNVADVTGRMHFNRLQRILSIAIDRDGDVGLMMVRSAGGFPQVQLVESHRIGDTNTQAQGDGTDWIDGVRLNSMGRAIAYRIVSEDVQGIRTAKEVPASDFILLSDPDRADQARGVTALYHAINTLHDKKEIIDFERKGVKLHSAIGAVLKKKFGDADNWKDDEAKGPDGQPLNLMKVLEGAEIPVISTEEELELTRSDRPSPAFTGFLEFLIRDMATGLGVPYEFVWNPEKIGGANTRFILEKAQRRFRERQDLLISTVLNRLWFWVISVGIARGDLPHNDQAWRVRWQLPADLSVDAGRDGNSDREDVKLGLMNEAEHFGRRGRDWQEERDQKEREVGDLLTRAARLAKAHGIEVGMALQLLQLSTPNGNLGGNQSQKPEDGKRGKESDKKKKEAKE